nr:cytoplasmic dynein 2 intermediate chain 1 isoform X2 [Nothobranchius furzeri]
MRSRHLPPWRRKVEKNTVIFGDKKKSFLRAKNDKSMHREKKITKEDTWRPADLRRHITEKAYDDGYARRRDDGERKHRGESMERRRRDPEESRQDGDKHRERDRTRERKDGDYRDRYSERRKESSQDQRGDKDRKDKEDRRDNKDKERKRLVDDDGGNREKRPDKGDTRDRERHRDRYKDEEKERVRDRERHRGEDTVKERRREEHRSERRRHEKSGKERRDETEKLQIEQRDRRHREDCEDKRKDGHTQERHRDRTHSEQKEGREHRRHEEESDRRHKERGHHGEKRERKSWEQQDIKSSADGFSPHQVDKDRRDRDKHKERRESKKEEEDADRRNKERRLREEDTKRSIREQADSKIKSSDRSHREKTKEVRVVSEQRRADVKDEEDAQEPVDLQEDLADQEYEDDFEDYEDDFEEADESVEESWDKQEEIIAQRQQEIDEIRRAMAKENERVGTTLHRQTKSREEEDQPRWSKDAASSDFEKKIKTSSHGKFINFVAARHREVSKEVASKQNKRGAELLRLIDLDYSTTFSLLDLPPVTEYEMYIRHFGNANTKQEYTQCNEDNPDRDIQTEEIDTSEKWTQHPPEHIGACGDPKSSQEARDKTNSDLCFDSHRLASFLQSASQVMVVLLEEDEAERKSLRKLKIQTESLSFSDGSLQLNTSLPFLLGRHISLVHFSQVQRHTMLSVHMPTVKASAVRLDSNTIICIWNIWEPSRPQKILLYESEVQCCCFSPGKSTLVFAGTSVGSVVLWDLRERASNHYSLKIGEEDWTFRQPTFSTDAVMSSSGHLSSVTSVEVVPFTVAGLSSEVPLLASKEELTGLSFQLASLDQSGVLNFWVVLELPKANEAGSPTDLGLRPGGKVKLLHSSSLLAADRTSSRDVVNTRQFQALLLKILPTDSNHFFIGTDLGLVSHGTSHGLKALPKFYRFQEVEERPVDISSIHFSPFKLHLFLVGCGDGSIRLHAVSRDRPVAEWRSSTAGEPLVSLQWSQTRPTVFCGLDAASNLYIWDLLESDAQPVIKERLTADRVTAMSVFGDSGQQTYSGVALAHQSGKIELHYFTKAFTTSSSAEEEQLESLMTEAF